MAAASRADVRPRSRAVATALAVIALAVGMLAPQSAAAAPAIQASSVAADVAATGIVQAADLSKFTPGNIVSDAVFFHKNSMTEAQIQTFLQGKVSTCRSGYTCVKDYYDTSRTTTADAMCGAYSGGVRERASRIIFKVAQACGINPQVILVMLQKEQGLITSTAPSSYAYRAAMGQGCPDTAACDTRYYGFFNQVFGGAWQLKRYANPPGTSQFFTWYAPGKTWDLLYHPNRACGTSRVTIQNQATSNLYYYTPYQPNAAALRAGYGTGNSCSSYGNRNFYNYFTDWFVSTQVIQNPCAVPSGSQVVAATGEYTVVPAGLNARSAPSTACETAKRTLSAGMVVTRVATYGDWFQVRYDKALMWVHGGYLAQTPAVGYTTERLTGASRYDTAVEVSREAYPTGTATVFITDGTDFPDALTAGAAAGHVGGSLLLTEPKSLRASTAAEIARLKPTKIVLVGGLTRISANVASQIAALVPGATTERLTGRDRYETSRLIAARFFAGATTAYVTTGKTFPDAIIASSLGGAQGRPVILVDGTGQTLDAATRSTFQTARMTNAVIVGGPDMVSAGIETGLTDAAIAVQRYAGRDRYGTARLLAEAAYPSGAPQVLVATGQNFPDALVGAVLAARTHTPLVTTATTCFEGATKDWVIRSGATSVTLLGGIPSLDDAVAASVRC
ncbi:cell wall-binding repeat-containing protein [Microbacterium sp. SSM24]|uniref:cell wall-binding repeat-containing protein n=1 Tax=Microbacterium sp. SSM24 TaxID=2991714 RepID=UPI002225E4E4|nr:cell wall-binding repeat-containing protein [Microbacterium sp. SSM24]MCW3493743.1 cell wall-binding repeat-containing protein [Microbacterium sp. SSM24]